MNIATTSSAHLAAGNVIELDLNGEATTGLVLLVNDLAVIIDRCDGSTPLVIQHDELSNVRVFSPLSLAA